MLKRDKILHQARQELYQIRCETSTSLPYDDQALADRFNYVKNESMIQAEFYHQCRIRKIPCILQVSFSFIGGWSLVDAMIQINDQIIMVEFKNFIIRDMMKLKEQVDRYSKFNFPILIISNDEFLGEILLLLEGTHLDNKAYVFNESLGKFLIFDTSV